MDLTCPQCNNIIKNSSLRLVQDSCGHKKCRGCLLDDEHECKLCITENETSMDVPNSDELNNTKPSVQTEQDDFCQLQHVLLQSEVKLKQEQIDFPETNTNTIKRTNLIPSHITIDKDRKYTCNICSRSFISKGYIKYHKYCINGGKRPYQCKNCPKSFINLSQLEVHELIHSNKKPFTCDICKKSFRQRSKLTRHKLLHNDTKSYNCEECDKAFKTKESLTSHIITHTTNKPFICAICNACFNNSSNYKKHLTIHNKDKPHMCDQCGKRFKLKWTLNIHKKIHISSKSFRCLLCFKVFTYAKDLQRHSLIHMDRKGYACGSCSVEFRRKDNLERHIRNLHPGKQIATIKKLTPINQSHKITEQILPSEVPFVDSHKNTNTADLLNNPQESANKTLDIPLLRRLDVVRDRPNAVTVIRAPPGISWKNDQRHAINAPLKLALKTNEFKNNYNIQSRSFVEPELEREVCGEIEDRRGGLTSCVSQKTSTIHYETSFDEEQHAIIKNIKFKLPAKYTNLKLAGGTIELGQRFGQVTVDTTVIVDKNDN